MCFISSFDVTPVAGADAACSERGTASIGWCEMALMRKGMAFQPRLGPDCEERAS